MPGIVVTVFRRLNGRHLTGYGWIGQRLPTTSARFSKRRSNRSLACDVAFSVAYRFSLCAVSVLKFYPG
jgi:hypothetical protein